PPARAPAPPRARPHAASPPSPSCPPPPPGPPARPRKRRHFVPPAPLARPSHEPCPHPVAHWMRTAMELGFHRNACVPPCVLLFVSLILVLSAAAPDLAHAQATGTIAGTVTEKDGKTPVRLATVSLLVTARGTMGEDDGNFVLRSVPVGTRTLKIMGLGYPDVLREVLVKAGETTYVKVRMGETRAVKTFDEITVVAHPMI